MIFLFPDLILFVGLSLKTNMPYVHSKAQTLFDNNHDVKYLPTCTTLRIVFSDIFSSVYVLLCYLPFLRLLLWPFLDEHLLVARELCDLHTLSHLKSKFGKFLKTQKS